MPKSSVSIIIVNYKVKKELFACIDSIKKTKPKSSYEIIIVDNDEDKTIEEDLLKKFPDVVYIPNPRNTGWGGGVNVGAKVAKGEYLYFLNPDTLLLSNAIDISLEFFRSHKNIGVVASLLLDKKEKVYPMQGTMELTPFRGAIAYSSINKHFPNNPISKAFFCEDLVRNKSFQVEIAPLTASFVRADVFKKVGMFDPQFFLYFEEYDLGRRINALSLKNYILPEARVVHFWESSTKQRNDRNVILERSRFLYFKKHFGLLQARIVESFFA